MAAHGTKYLKKTKTEREAEFKMIDWKNSSVQEKARELAAELGNMIRRMGHYQSLHDAHAKAVLLHAQTCKPTQAEELLYKFVIAGPTVITYMGQHDRGRAYINDLQTIFDGACKHLIARQIQGVDFTHLNPNRVQKASAPACVNSHAENPEEMEAVSIVAN
jgi:hypothetical protein